jgi:4-amino-4-deoxy-L-arabinose transferase-like glycosyltransferase
MQYCKDKIMSHKGIFVLLLLFLILHGINLTLLPIFNDESIYLDWGWTYTHMPGHLYDSLLDAKQPLMIWVFGIFENFFSDPLFAGRFASVIIGAITTLGIYTLTKKLFTKQIALLAALLYTIIPLFVFYNRQALMESAIACIGIWSGNALLMLFRQPTTRNGVIVGILFGIGFFIKSSILLFIIPSSLIILYSIGKNNKKELIQPYFISLGAMIAIDSLLFLSPVFWETFSSNSRYSYTLAEMFTFPIQAWLHHILAFFEIGFIFITPLIFLTSLLGIALMLKTNKQNHTIFLAYFLLALLLEMFSAKSQSQRYLVPFLPFLIIPAAYVFWILWSSSFWKKTIVLISLAFPIILSLMIIVTPKEYLLQLSNISQYADRGYLFGQTAGYGIKETMHYLNEHTSPSRPSLVVFGLHTGNPENAIDIYAQKSPNLYPLHIDSQLIPGLDQYQCLTSQYPLFFVTRQDQLLGLDRFFSLTKSFHNPHTSYTTRIYTLKKDCEGKTLSLSDFYQGAMKQIDTMR